METVIYTVKKGDTLFDIAKRYCTTVNMIARYNGIPDPDYIEPGRILRIPVSEIPSMKPEKCMPYREYIVKKGDTLAGIAVRTGVSVQRIAAFNRLSDPSAIKEGQVLRIPLLPEYKSKKEYVVKKGDTLTEIAAKSDTTANTLAEQNGIADMDVIFEGQGITLPETDNSNEYEDTAEEANQTDDRRFDTERRDYSADVMMNSNNRDYGTDETDSTEGRIEYIVQSGDTLWQIARKFGVSIAYLINLNRITNPDRIYPEQVLIIRR